MPDFLGELADVARAAHVGPPHGGRRSLPGWQWWALRSLANFWNYDVDKGKAKGKFDMSDRATPKNAFAKFVVAALQGIDPSITSANVWTLWNRKHPKPLPKAKK